MKRGKKAVSTGEAIVIVFIVVIVIFVFFVDFITCPVCRNIPLIKHACPICGGDGKITLLQYILHSSRSALDRGKGIKLIFQCFLVSAKY